MHPALPELNRICSVVERQVAHLTRLVDDLLDVARITRGKVVLQRKPTTLDAIIAQAVEICSGLIEEAGHQLTVVKPQHEVTIVADHARLVQAVANVLANAVKFTPEPGRIALTAEVAGGIVTIRVTDNGIGIESGALDRIFELFAQADAASPRLKSGLGIGLSLTRQFVEMHGGNVHAASEGPGRGSEFVLSFPRDVMPAGEQPSAMALALPASGRDLAPRVLIVDDNRDAADMLLSLFRAHGYQVSCVYCGSDAISEAARFAPDAIVMDLAMPGMDGYETARRLRQSAVGRSVVLIALTGWGQERTRRKALEAGFDFHAVKPVEIEVLKGYITQSKLQGEKSTA